VGPGPETRKDFLRSLERLHNNRQRRCNANRGGSETQVSAIACAPPRVDVSAKLRGVPIVALANLCELVQAADAYFLRGSVLVVAVRLVGHRLEIPDDADPRRVLSKNSK